MQSLRIFHCETVFITNRLGLDLLAFYLHFLFLLYFLQHLHYLTLLSPLYVFVLQDLVADQIKSLENAVIKLDQNSQILHNLWKPNQVVTLQNLTYITGMNLVLI